MRRGVVEAHHGLRCANGVGERAAARRDDDRAGLGGNRGEPPGQVASKRVATAKLDDDDVLEHEYSRLGRP